ncbi:MAG: aldehyde dehydrogenase family protein [Chloroflexi bacterium]|nr:aldehyde dehydrogenase family protein [Chloroflexota bacterium]
MAVLEQQSLNGQREMITIKNPVTEEELGSIPVMTADDIRAAVDRARAAQPMWQALGVRQRGRLLTRWKNMIWKDQKTCMAIIRRETGKTDANAFIELCILDSAVDYNVSRAPGLLRDQYRPSFIPLLHRAKVTYKPHGVVGFITPWNYPFMNALSDLIAALAMGNTAVLKPSEVTPYTAFYAVEMMHKAGIPKDVVQVVTGDGRTGAALVDYVDYIMFTGSTANGKKVALRAAERLIPVRWNSAAKTRSSSSTMLISTPRPRARCAARSKTRGRPACASSGCTWRAASMTLLCRRSSSTRTSW